MKLIMILWTSSSLGISSLFVSLCRYRITTENQWALWNFHFLLLHLYLSIDPSMHPCIHLSIYPSIQSIHLSIHLSSLSTIHMQIFTWCIYIRTIIYIYSIQLTLRIKNNDIFEWVFLGDDFSLGDGYSMWMMHCLPLRILKIMHIEYNNTTRCYKWITNQIIMLHRNVHI